MSQKFVMLFLVSKTKIVTLDVAAKILIEESQDTPDHSKFKSKSFHLTHVSAQKGKLADAASCLGNKYIQRGFLLMVVVLEKCIPCAHKSPPCYKRSVS